MGELTMSQHIIKENSFLLYSLLMGIGVTFIYDFFRIFRQLVPHKDFAVSLEDIIFWIFCAISVFYLLYRESNGTLRWFAVLGAGLGMLTYKKTISGLFVNVMVKILGRILKVIGKILSFLWKPFGIAAGKIRKAYKKAGKKGNKCAGFFKKKLTVCTKLLKMVLCKQ